MSMSVPGNSCRTTKCCVSSTSTGCTIKVYGECVYYSGTNLSGPSINTGDTFNTVVTKLTNYISSGPGTVTSVGATITAGAISIAGSPITTAGTLAFTYTGNSSQYVRGDGSLATIQATSNSIIPYISADFDIDGITVTDASLNGRTFELFLNDLNRFIYNEVGNQEWDYVVGGGFQILLPGFDANTFDYHLYLFPKT
jgi:hypothetical protein